MTRKAAMHKEDVHEKGQEEQFSAEQPLEIKPEVSVGEAADASVTEADARVQELEKSLEEAQLQAEKYRGEMMRFAADFENFRKQKERELQMAGTRSLENTIRELLPFFDDMGRVMEHAPDVMEKAQEIRPYVEGVELLWKNLLKWMESKGVRKIEACGKKMDVNFHEAITQIDHPDAEPDTVIEEYQTGYVMGDKVLRHAKVIVAR